MIIGILGGIVLIVAILIISYLLMIWADSRPCSLCLPYKEELEKRIEYCFDCSEQAHLFYCKKCHKKRFKKRGPNKLIQVYRRIKKIRRRRKNK